MTNPHWTPLRPVRDSKDPLQLELPLDMPPITLPRHRRGEEKTP